MLSERALTDAVCRVSPWLAPLPTAYLTYLRTMQHLGWPWYISGMAGLVVEGVGLAAVNTALEFREHNQGLKDEDKRTAPFAVAAGIAAVYFTSVIGLTIILDTVAEAARYAPLVFPVLSICGAMLIAMRQDHARRVEEMTLSLQAPYNKKRHRLQRAQMLAELAGEIAPVAEKPREKKAPPETLRDLAPGARRERLLGVWAQDGRKTFTELAGTFGVSRQTIGNDFAALAKDGKAKRQGRQVVVN